MKSHILLFLLHAWPKNGKQLNGLGGAKLDPFNFAKHFLAAGRKHQSGILFAASASLVELSFSRRFLQITIILAWGLLRSNEDDLRTSLLSEIVALRVFGFARQHYERAISISLGRKTAERERVEEQPLSQIPSSSLAIGFIQT